MGTWGLIVRRARAGLGLLVTILALTAATTAIIAGTLGYSQAAATTAARQALTGAVPTEAGLRVQTRLAADPGAQDAAARRVVTATFAPAEVEIQRTLATEPRTVEGHPERLVTLASDQLLADAPGFTALVEVDEGTWPTGPGAGGDAAVPAALHAGTAQAWGVSPGDTLMLGGQAITVEATWRPTSAQAAFWFGDPLVATGRDGSVVGPLVVHPDAITRLGDTPFVRFTVQPDADQVTPADMALLSGAADKLPRAMDVPEVASRGVTVEGDLAPTTANASRNLATARALNAIPIILLLLVSVIAVVQIARLQATARSGEVELFVARGAARRQVLRWTLTEAVVITAVATALGVGVALAVMQAVPAGGQQTSDVVRAGVLTGLAVLVALVVISVLQVRTLAARSSTDRSGRTRQVAALATLVFTLAAAGLATWQLAQYRSPLVTGDDGTLRTDLVAGAAPALLLAAAAVLTMALLGPASRVAEALTRPTRGLGSHLAASQVSRRLVVYAVPVVLTVLAAGSTTVASLYAATSTSLREDLSLIGQGADVRGVLVDAPTSRGEVATVPDVSGLPGVTASAPVWLSQTKVAGTPLTVTVLPVRSLTAVSRMPPGLVDTSSLDRLQRRDADQQGVALPEGGTELTLPVRLTAQLTAQDRQYLEAAYANVEEDFELTCPGCADDVPKDVLRDVFAEQRRALGAAYELPHELLVSITVTDPEALGRQTLSLTPVPFSIPARFEDGRLVTEPVQVDQQLTIAVPPGIDRRLVAVTVDLPQIGEPYQARLTVDGVRTADGDNLLAQPGPATWVDPLSAAPDQPLGIPTEGTMAVDQASGTLTLDARTGVDFTGAPEGPGDRRAALTLGPVLAAQDAPVPVAVTEAFAEANSLGVGAPLEIATQGVRISTQVVALLPAVPGTLDPNAALLDSTTLAGYLNTLGLATDAPTQIWMASQDPQRTAEAVAATEGFAQAIGPGAVSVTDAAGAVRLVFWVASAGAVLLAITGIAAVAANLLRARRPEVAVLRALGMAPRSQALSRVAELAGVVGVCIAVGVGAGWLVGLRVIPDLASSTTSSGQVTLQPGLSLEVPWWAALVGLLVLAVLLVLAAQVWRVVRQALDTTYREEIR